MTKTPFKNIRKKQVDSRSFQHLKPLIMSQATPAFIGRDKN